jgi:hypothetical protein
MGKFLSDVQNGVRKKSTSTGAMSPNGQMPGSEESNISENMGKIGTPPDDDGEFDISPYHPDKDSPLLEAGKLVNLPEDYDGNPIPAGGPVTIGLFQK